MMRARPLGHAVIYFLFVTVYFEASVSVFSNYPQEKEKPLISKQNVPDIPKKMDNFPSIFSTSKEK